MKKVTVRNNEANESASKVMNFQLAETGQKNALVADVFKSRMSTMVAEQKKDKILIYPENDLKIVWDYVVTAMLIFTCIVTPYRIAFENVDTFGWLIANYGIDFLFLVDICLNFNCAYYDDDLAIIEDRCTIAKNYALSWLIIDVLAIFPFDLIA